MHLSFIHPEPPSDGWETAGWQGRLLCKYRAVFVGPAVSEGQVV